MSLNSNSCSFQVSHSFKSFFFHVTIFSIKITNVKKKKTLFNRFIYHKTLEYSEKNLFSQNNKRKNILNEINIGADIETLVNNVCLTAENDDDDNLSGSCHNKQ